MLTFETVNELTLKVTCTGSDVLFTKAGAFIAGENAGGKNYKFEKVLLGPQNNIGQALQANYNKWVRKSAWSACTKSDRRKSPTYEGNFKW